MDIKFGSLTFSVGADGRVCLVGFGDFECGKSGAFCEIDVTGGNTSGSLLMSGSDCSKKLKYRTHTIDNGVLTIVTASDDSKNSVINSMSAVFKLF